MPMLRHTAGRVGDEGECAVWGWEGQ
eukprot:SAG11_NODE_38508_length_252_cov_0.666667_1_plen_25_part_01